MRPHGPHPHDLLAGMHPASSGSCQRCGATTTALANGRGRLDICGRCGTFDLTTPEGIEVFSLRDLSLPTATRRAR
jgi:ribosomal protein S27AE